MEYKLEDITINGRPYGIGLYVVEDEPERMIREYHPNHMGDIRLTSSKITLSRTLPDQIIRLHDLCGHLHNQEFEFEAFYRPYKQPKRIKGKGFILSFDYNNEPPNEKAVLDITVQERTVSTLGPDIDQLIEDARNAFIEATDDEPTTLILGEVAHLLLQEKNRNQPKNNTHQPKGRTIIQYEGYDVIRLADVNDSEEKPFIRMGTGYSK